MDYKIYGGFTMLACFYLTAANIPESKTGNGINRTAWSIVLILKVTNQGTYGKESLQSVYCVGTQCYALLDDY